MFRASATASFISLFHPQQMGLPGLWGCKVYRNEISLIHDTWYIWSSDCMDKLKFSRGVSFGHPNIQIVYFFFFYKINTFILDRIWMKLNSASAPRVFAPKIILDVVHYLLLTYRTFATCTEPLPCLLRQGESWGAWSCLTSPPPASQDYPPHFLVEHPPHNRIIFALIFITKIV